MRRGKLPGKDVSEEQRVMTQIQVKEREYMKPLVDSFEKEEAEVCPSLLEQLGTFAAVESRIDRKHKVRISEKATVAMSKHAKEMKKKKTAPEGICAGTPSG